MREDTSEDLKHPSDDQLSAAAGVVRSSNGDSVNTNCFKLIFVIYFLCSLFFVFFLMHLLL